jgi:hypothetical protein
MPLGRFLTLRRGFASISLWPPRSPQARGVLTRADWLASTRLAPFPHSSGAEEMGSRSRVLSPESSLAIGHGSDVSWTGSRQRCLAATRNWVRWATTPQLGTFVSARLQQHSRRIFASPPVAAFRDHPRQATPVVFAPSLNGSGTLAPDQVGV